MEVLEFADDLCQLGKIPCRADIDHTDIHFSIENPHKRLKFKQLVQKSAVSIVCCVGETDVLFPSVAYPFQQVGVFRLRQVLVRQHDAVTIISQVLRLQESVFAVFKPLHIVREHQHKAAESKPYLVTLEKHIRARRVNIYMILLQKTGKRRDLRMLDRIEEKRYLIIVRQFAGRFQLINEP